MAEYVYEGPGPVEDEGELVHPGDIRDFGEEPDCPPWRRLDPEPAPAGDPPPPAAVTPATTRATGTEGGM
jgi:hypothetical protein